MGIETGIDFKLQCENFHILLCKQIAYYYASKFRERKLQFHMNNPLELRT